jgi:hypothetical protein
MRFRNLNMQRYVYFTKINLEHEWNSICVSLNLPKYNAVNVEVHFRCLDLKDKIQINEKCTFQELQNFLLFLWDFS